MLDLPRRCRSLAFNRLGDESLGPLLVSRIGPCHTPVGHGAGGVDDGCLPERTLGLQVPKTVKLTKPLVEESLALGLLGGYGKVNLGHAFHEVGSLPRSLVESFPVSRMPGGHGSVVVLLLGEKRRDKQSDEDCN